ncbi:heme A synthase [Yoonia sediminilitoris]|uniref:Heme A synthase n=1 Tax=Yoonia sediminilitoris TaxID=1286148 RepID=A0A2T6KCL9_9RHOB|nr:heme A synthase [Yoonia sediminilitoris]PUB12712.1 cytochrome c oxidase assembly protein subunit 15 [Yoonia sediminilitoris]RCW94191.1 cytochrome c oxidase assembly protein subunit 15 [Yoonia sediminilitoris]
MATKRSIFEEVGDTPKQVAAPGGIGKVAQGARGAIRVWLMALFALVVVMIVVGGLTRLTDSGLSITEWKPVTGALPPLSADVWQSEFDKYRAIPEYQLQNKGMTLTEFKVIYYWEWGHRQLGRVIGLVWAAGFLFFLATRKIPAGWTGRLLFIGALGGLQGFIGWWMVSSGLEEGMLDVASYRLATHLGLAFVIFGFISWYVYRLGRTQADLLQARRSGDAGLARMTSFLVGFAFFQILLGALVAGIDAGRAYPDWPLMAGGFLPPQPFDLQPLWRNFFEDAGLVQFMHRMAGYLLFLFGLVVWLRARKSANDLTRFAFNAVMALMLVQMVLGIVTVIYAAPWQIAIVHQLGAVVLWALILRARFLAQYPLPQSIKGA